MGLGRSVVKALPVIGDVASAAMGVIRSGASARQQMRFQERMRATQYQTAVEDMRKAGLNPMLAFDQGGAGNLSGSSFDADFGTPGSSALRVAQSERERERLNAELKLMKEQTNKTAADAGLARASAIRQVTDSQVAAGGWANRIFGTEIGSIIGRGWRGLIQEGDKGLEKLIRRLEQGGESEANMRTREEIARARLRRSNPSIWKQIGDFFSGAGRRQRHRGSGGF